MKTGRIFWGAFFVVVGLLVLFYNLDYVQIDWTYTWKLWPLILIFWGLSKFTENKPLRITFAAFNGAVLACMVFGFFSLQWFNDVDFDTDSPRYSQHLLEPFDKSVEHATFSFNSGAGRFTMGDTTANLIDAETESGFGRYVLDKNQSDGTTDISLRMRDRRTFRFFGRWRNEANIRLNSQPSWEMRFDAGASKLDLDLSPYKTDKVTIDAGASTIRVKLGNRADETNIRVKTGVSTVRIEIPSSSGCEIRDNAHVGSSHFEDFQKEEDGVWRTDNFETAKNKVYLEVDAGVSSIRVKRY